MNDFAFGRKSGLSIFVLGFLLPLGYALFTNHAWEDWYITYRASKNLAIGNGLVFTVGERVHTFTSPLGTLVPSALAFVTGAESDDLVLWLFRLVNCALIGATAVMLLTLGRRLLTSRYAIALLLGMFLLDAKTLDFSINGMESAFVVCFLTLALYSVLVPTRYPSLVMGLSWAGLMWTRPDSFVYILAIGAGFFLFHPGTGTENGRGQLIRRFLAAGTVATLAYAPWLIWAWSYYGSFVPHTVAAKGLNYHPFTDWLHATKAVVAYPVLSLVRPSAFDGVFLPAYSGFWDWPVVVSATARAAAWACAFLWLLPFVRPLARALSLAVLVFHLYLAFGMRFVYPWYLPGVTLLSIMVVALLFDQLLWSRRQHEPDTAMRGNDALPPKGSGRGPVPAALVLASLLACLTLATLSAYQARIQQEVVEEENRKQVGLWLRDNASSPSDRVFVEPLGYIGFYSNLKMYDFPGLSSPEVVAARKQVGARLGTADYAKLIAYLRPEWVVLRPHEVRKVNEDSPGLLETSYSLAKTFDVSKRLASYSFLPGRRLLVFDQTFLVFRRTEAERKGA
jgi:hypothetical protein